MSGYVKVGESVEVKGEIVNLEKWVAKAKNQVDGREEGCGS